VSHRHSYFSWWWAHGRPKHVEKRNKYIKKKFAPSWFIYKIIQGCRSTKHKKKHNVHFKALSYKIPATFSKVGNSEIFTSRLNIAIPLLFPITPWSSQALTAVVAQMISLPANSIQSHWLGIRSIPLSPSADPTGQIVANLLYNRYIFSSLKHPTESVTLKMEPAH